MPVHRAGSRLYKSVPFKHLVKKAGSGAGARASNISLNLVTSHRSQMQPQA